MVIAMAKPTARVLVLLEVLQSGGTHRARDLASRLEVDERTVRRYVDHLRELDVPVEAVRGRYGGYRLAPGFRLPPLMLTDDEAVSVLLGLALLRGPDSPEQDAASSTDAKIRRVLPPALARRLDALRERLQLSSTPPGSPPGTSSADAATLLLLAEAARDHRLVGFAYRSAAGRDSARVLAPYGLVAHRGRWLVTGRDEASGEVRSFRVDRMVLPRRLERTFEAPERFDAVEQVRRGIATAPRRHRVVVRARASAEHVRVSLPDTLAVVVEESPGWVRIELQAESLDWVPAFLARLDCPFVVVDPEALKADVAALGRRLLAAGEA